MMHYTSERLVASKTQSLSEIIKPVLRGRDIQRYVARWADLWLIDTHNGHDGFAAIEVDEYPAVRDYLSIFQIQLENRQDKGVTPYNLRSCAYHDDFKKEKIFWMHMSPEGRFAYSIEGEIYCNNKGYIMTGKSMKFLCALLNSKIVCWFLSHVAPTSGMGTLRWKKAYVETIPVPRVSVAEQELFTTIVDCILSAKDADLHADTSALESKIDAMVYGLYGLSDAEITVIEASQQ